MHTRLSQPKFAENEATLLLSLLAYNLAETLRRETESVTGSGWDLSRFQRTVLQTGARLVKGGGRVRFLLMRPFARIWTMLAKRLSQLGRSAGVRQERHSLAASTRARISHLYAPTLTPGNLSNGRLP